MEDITQDTLDEALNIVPTEEVTKETPVEMPEEPELEPVEPVAEVPKVETEEQIKHRKSGIQRLKEQRDRERMAREKAEQALADLQSRNAAFRDDGKPDEAQFDTYDAFLNAKVDWAIAQRERQAIQEAANAKAKELHDYQQARIASFHQAHPDLKDLLNDLDHQGVPFTRQMRTIVDDSDVGGEILHYLAKNPDEIRRIASLPVGKQMKELGQLEDRFEQPAKPAKTTHAPRPVSPVMGGSAISRVKDGDLELY